MLDPTSVTVGAAIGTLAFTALSMLLASRKDRKAREKRRQFAEMQRAIFDVQDQAFFCQAHPTTNVESICARDDEMLNLQAARDRAAAAYLEG